MLCYSVVKAGKDIAFCRKMGEMSFSKRHFPHMRFSDEATLNVSN